MICGMTICQENVRKTDELGPHLNFYLDKDKKVEIDINGQETIKLTEEDVTAIIEFLEKSKS